MESADVQVDQSSDHQQRTAIVYYNVPIEVGIQSIEVMYFCITAEQLSEFTNMGRLLDFFLALFGIASGTVISTWLALLQGGLTPEGIATLSTTMWASVIVSIVFLVCTALLYYHQWKQLSKWTASQINISKKNPIDQISQNASKQ